VQGLKQLEGKLKELLPENPKMAQAAQQLVAETSKMAADQMRANARSAGWPSAAVNSIFSYGQSQPGKRKKITALAGVNKRRNMAEWTATANPRSPNAKVGAGGKVAMSLPTMYEFGTSRMRAHPAIRPAVQQVRGQVVSQLSAGITDIISRTAKS